MKNIFALAIIWFVLIGIDSCKKIPYEFKDNPTCHDGRQNQNETGIDCGGPCTPCADAALMHSKKYYISFMFDNTPVVLQSDTDFAPYDPSHGSTIEGNITTAAGLSGNYAKLSLDLSSIQQSEITALVHDTLYFEYYVYPGNEAHLDLNGLVGAFESSALVLIISINSDSFSIISASFIFLSSFSSLFTMEVILLALCSNKVNLTSGFLLLLRQTLTSN